jgi:hypothetical protein
LDDDGDERAKTVALSMTGALLCQEWLACSSRYLYLAFAMMENNNFTSGSKYDVRR